MSSDYVPIVFLLAEALHRFVAEILNSEFRRRRSTWWLWRVTLVAPRIVTDVSFVMPINDDIHFAWQGQYLVKLEWLFVAGAAFGASLGDSRSAKCCIFQYKIFSKMGRVRSPKPRVRDDGFIVGMSSDCRRIMFESSFYWRKHFTDLSLKSWTQNFVAGAVLGDFEGWL